MNVVNKSLASILEAPAIITMMQMVIAVVVMSITSIRALLNADRKQLCIWLIVPVFFSAMLTSSFYTFQHISLSLLTIVRNLMPLMVLPIERLVMPPESQPQVSSWVIGSIV